MAKTFFRSPIALAAFLWGLSGFFPVGMSYLAAALLITSLLVWRKSDPLLNRWKRIRQHSIFWALVFFLGWTTLVYLLQTHYTETPSNLFHIVRIACTIVVILSLKQHEALAGIAGWLTGCLLTLLVIYTNLWVTLPHIVGIKDMLQMYGNKSISIAILLSVFASCALMYAIDTERDLLGRLGFIPILFIIPILIWLLPSRTSLILIAVSVFFGLLHRFLRKPAVLLPSVVALFLLGWGTAQVPEVQTRFAVGIAELQKSSARGFVADQSLTNSSWGMRYLHYTHTFNMVVEKPVMGWGIGAWNDQWKKRTPPELHASNMPHNEFLWMGSQAGVMGIVSLVALVLALYWSVLCRRNTAATASLTATTGMFVAMSFNSALRDAQIGMSVLFVVLAINVYALAQQD
jgi:O-antigen ligase